MPRGLFFFFVKECQSGGARIRSKPLMDRVLVLSRSVFYRVEEVAGEVGDVR